MKLPNKLTEEQKKNIRVFKGLYTNAMIYMEIIDRAKFVGEGAGKTSKSQVLAQAEFDKLAKSIKMIFDKMDDIEKNLSVAFLTCKYVDLGIDELIDLQSPREKSEYIKRFLNVLGYGIDAKTCKPSVKN